MKSGLYGSKRIPIFTVEKIKDGFKRVQENTRIGKMIDQIQTDYGQLHTPKMTQILIHSLKCPACRESIPLWNNLTYELGRILPHYLSTKIEYDQESDFNGVKITGSEIYEKLNLSGIPFVIQNFEVVKRNILSNGKEYYAIVNSNDWIVSYEGKISPFGFLSKIFKIRNRFLDSLRSSQKFYDI